MALFILAMWNHFEMFLLGFQNTIKIDAVYFGIIIPELKKKTSCYSVFCFGESIINHKQAS